MFTHPDGYLEAREQHYQRFFGALNQPVTHSTDIKAVHIDIYRFEPTKERPYWTLVTSGMSDERQLEPEDCPEHMSPRAEILMYVSEPQGWMFNVLKGLAEMPFENSTCLHWWHTVPNGMPMTAKLSLLTSFFFLPPYFESEDFANFQLDDDQVDFLWMIPITEAEREYAIEHGSQQLASRFEDAKMSRIVDESRQSVV